jgi:hypothetical protein
MSHSQQTHSQQTHSQQTHSQQTHQQAYIEQGLPQDLIDYASNDQSAMMEALNYPNEPNEDNTIELDMDDIMSEALKDYDKVYDEINWDYHDNILETEEEVIPPIDYVEEDIEHGYYYEHYHNFSTPLEINHSGLEYITTALSFVLGVVVTLVFKL